MLKPKIYTTLNILANNSVKVGLEYYFPILASSITDWEKLLFRSVYIYLGSSVALQWSYCCWQKF